MTAVPVRIPEAWSAAWFRVFYNEVLAKEQAASTGVTQSALDAALALHNARPDAHALIPRVDKGALETFAFFVSR